MVGHADEEFVIPVSEAKRPHLFSRRLTGVEQEVNGLHTFHRKPKCDPQVISAIMRKAAEIEQRRPPT